MLAADQHDLDVIPNALVIVIRRAVMQVHIVQPLQGVEIAAAQENDGTFLRGIGFFALVFRKKNTVWEMGVRTSLKEYSLFRSKTISEMLLILP